MATEGGDRPGEVVAGPWGSTPVVQPPQGSPERWWRRGPDGALFVWCGVGGDAMSWRRAPVPLAPLRWPLPDRPPDPGRITLALDGRGLEGPEVDEALGVHNAFDTTVDSWEDGSLVPSGDEVRRLATLTGYPPAFFYGGPLPKAEQVFMCGPRDMDLGPPSSRLPVPDRRSMDEHRLPRPRPRPRPPARRRGPRCVVCNDLPLDPPCLDCPPG